MASPMMEAIDQMLWATPLAAIWAVPNRATMLDRATFTSWWTPFSTPLGRATPMIRRSRSPSRVKISPVR